MMIKLIYRIVENIGEFRFGEKFVEHPTNEIWILKFCKFDGEPLVICQYFNPANDFYYMVVT